MYVPKTAGERVRVTPPDLPDSGEYTGESGWADEHFVIEFEDGSTARLHKEDIEAIRGTKSER